jgi:uncharacterized membrane protein YfcA
MLVLTATVFAFLGALVGRQLLPRVTVKSMRYLTGVLLLIVGVGLAVGLV